MKERLDLITKKQIEMLRSGKINNESTKQIRKELDKTMRGIGGE